MDILFALMILIIIDAGIWFRFIHNTRIIERLIMIVLTDVVLFISYLKSIS